MRIVFNRVINFAKTTTKKTLSSNIEKPESKIIVDPSSFRKTGLI